MHNRSWICAVIAIVALVTFSFRATSQERTGTFPAGVIRPLPPKPNNLDDTCIVAILNRTTQVRADGTWNLPNVPANFGLVRARASCVRNGVTVFGQSDLFSLAANQSITLPHITLGNASPIPTALTITAPILTLTQPGQTAQLNVIATYQSGATQNVTSAASGTQYLATNAAIATVSANGLVTATGSGNVIVQALNEGAQGVIRFSVTFSNDSDGDGIPDDAEIRLGLNPNDATDGLLDADLDGLTNLQEFQIGTDMRKADSDGDGLSDGQEVLLYQTNPLLISSDGSGIPDGIEVQTGTLNATLTAKIAAALSSIEVQPASFVLSVNTIEGIASQQLTILGHLIDGKTTLDITSTQRGTTYQSTDLNVCNFGSPDGNVFAGASGSCTITIRNGTVTGQSSGIVRSFSPTPLSFITIPGFANGVAANGDIVYVAAGAQGLRVVNVANRTSPAIVGSLVLPGNANAVKLFGNFAIIAAGTAGIHAVDVSNPAAPVLRGTLSTTGTALDVAVAGNIAYIANSTNLVLANITNPTLMSRISSLALTGQIRGVSVDTQRGLAAVAANTSGVYLVDISNPLNPTQRSQVALNGARQVVIKGNEVFAARFTSPYQASLTAIDITNPAFPTTQSSITNQSLGGNLNDLALVDKFVLAADVFFVNGISITDVSNPNGLLSRATLNFPQRDDNGMSIAADASYVYLTTDHTATDKFVASGDGRLYIGQYRAVEDIKGVPPSVTVTSPPAGSPVVAGATVPATVAATDDVAVAAVSLQVNHQTVFTRTTPPYQFNFTVPTGVSSVTLSATAVDLGGNVATSPDIVLPIVPDPGTTVVGRVLNSGNVISGATVTTNGGRTSTSGVDGRFSITNVPTVLGDIRVTAVATVNGSQVSSTSSAFVPVPGGTTDIGDLSLVPTLVNFDAIPGITPMANAAGQVVPTAARLSTQLQLSQGISFSSGVAYIAVVLLGVGHATSGPNGIGGVNASNQLSYGTAVTATFTVPGDPSTPGVTDFVSVRGDTAPGSGTATLQAFDINGNLLGSDTKPDISGGLTLSLSIKGIHSIVVSETQANIAFDDFRFNSPIAAGPQ
jgi:hypothetical protein